MVQACTLVSLNSADWLACLRLPANSHALGMSLTPVGWKLWSHASSCLCPKTGTGKCEGCFRRSSQTDFFGRLWTSSGIFENDCVVFKNPSTPRIKISRLYFRKSWQIYLRLALNDGNGNTIQWKDCSLHFNPGLQSAVYSMQSAFYTADRICKCLFE